ncbi:MAG: hypothetical protein ACYC91_17155 [Solirubrobacteraceae bacterium]
MQRDQDRATVTIRWKGGAITELAVALPRHQPTIRTDEDTIALLTRLAAHYDDATIAGILNRQGRRSATGERFTTIITRNSPVRPHPHERKGSVTMAPRNPGNPGRAPSRTSSTAAGTP